MVGNLANGLNPRYLFANAISVSTHSIQQASESAVDADGGMPEAECLPLAPLCVDS